MNKGRATCEVLKGIRLQIARENCIDYQIDECKFEGNCSGTCPKCEADIRFLERELLKQNKLGKAVVIAGLSVGLLGGLTGCGHENHIKSITPISKEKQNQEIKTIDTLSLQKRSNKKDKKDVILFTVTNVLSFKEFDSYIFEDTSEAYNNVIGGIIETEIDSTSYRFVEQMPEFPGGNDSLLIYLKNNIQYPENCKKDSISGVVLIEFIIEKDGSVTNVKPIVKAVPELDAEAVRVIENMPKWKPGKQQGKPVRVSMQIPIRFSIQ